MAMGEHKNWRELCHAALEAKDPNELLAQQGLKARRAGPS